jgi:thiamine transport system permease protein
LRGRGALLGILLWAPPLAFLAIFYFYPLLSIIQVSLARGPGGLAQPLLEALASPSIRRVLWFTIWQAAASTALTLLVGLPGAYLLARYQFRGKSLLRALTAIPFVLPTLVVATAFSALLGPRGWVNLALMEFFNLSSPPLRVLHTVGAILLAHVFYNTTIVLRMVGDFWSHLDPRLAAAARVLGANRWQTLRRVVLPLLMPAILTAALLVFIFDFTSFGVILVLGGPRYATLEVEIYYQTISLFNLPTAAALSLLQLACTLGLTVLYTRLASRLQRPLPLAAAARTQRPPLTWRSRLFVGALVAFLLILLVSPLAALAARSFARLEPDRGQRAPIRPGLTLEFYRSLWESRRESLAYVTPVTAVGISLGYATATAALSLALGLPAAWGLARRPAGPFQRLLDPLLMLPLGTSAVTLGLGFILALDTPPLDLRASPALIPLAHTLVAFPFVVRSLTPALRSIRPRLRQAAYVLGVPPWQAILKVDLPLVGRAVLVGASFAFAISLGEFGATALIARPEFPTLPVLIYRFLSQPGGLNYGMALALSTILMVITGGAILAIERFRLARIGEF